MRVSWASGGFSSASISGTSINHQGETPRGPTNDDKGSDQNNNKWAALGGIKLAKSPTNEQHHDDNNKTITKRRVMFMS